MTAGHWAEFVRDEVLQEDRCHFKVGVGECSGPIQRDDVGWPFEAPDRRLDFVADPNAAGSGCRGVAGAG